jgi:ferredoxin
MPGRGNQAGHRARARENLSLNAEFAKTWPNITAKKDPPADAKAWDDVPDKFEHFSPDPGTGD